jgi:hypothetical protein
MEDVLAEALWYAVWLTPLVTIPFSWYVFKRVPKVLRVLIGLVLAAVISYLIVLFIVSISFMGHN